jgi:hypothetical protein|tara:strand:- start:1079 stop:1216 length:138 start_codon:yes stop_codon:yes gene_type:complete
MRFNEEAPKQKQVKKDANKKPREMTKAGAYSSKELEKSKTTPWRQ